MGFRIHQILAPAAVVCIALLAPSPATSAAGEDGSSEQLIASFAKAWPDIYARLIGIERAQGILYGALARGKGKVGEADVFRQMRERVATSASPDRPDADADRGYAALGARTAEIIRRTHTFHRELLAIFAGVDRSGRERALDAAVDRYRSRVDVALPDVPKDMTILYDHPYTSFVEEDLNPRRQLTYPTLIGFTWASRWFELAAQEPLEVFSEAADRRQGLTLVANRFERKLAAGKPPDAFPTELPLAPSISPGLVTAHLRAAAILDNLNMMQDVIADVLVHPKVTDRRAAIDQVVAQFTNPTERIVAVDDWITMALRHSIFAQGGPALGTMTETDRNSSGHFQHGRGGRSIPPGGMR